MACQLIQGSGVRDVRYRRGASMTAPIYTDPYRIAAKYIGMKEAPGAINNPAIVAMLDLCDPGVHDDETAVSHRLA